MFCSCWPLLTSGQGSGASLHPANAQSVPLPTVVRCTCHSSCSSWEASSGSVFPPPRGNSEWPPQVWTAPLAMTLRWSTHHVEFQAYVENQEPQDGGFSGPCVFCLKIKTLKLFSGTPADCLFSPLLWKSEYYAFTHSWALWFMLQFLIFKASFQTLEKGRAFFFSSQTFDISSQNPWLSIPWFLL